MVPKKKLKRSKFTKKQNKYKKVSKNKNSTSWKRRKLLRGVSKSDNTERPTYRRMKLKPNNRIIEPFNEYNSEGKCALHEENTSSEEEQYEIKKSRKEVEQEKRESRKECQRKDGKRDKYHLKIVNRRYIEKHARKKRE